MKEKELKNKEKLDKTKGSNMLNSSAGDIDKIKKERDEYLDGWKRAIADLSNYKKSEMERAQNMISSSNKDLVKNLLKVLDSFDLAAPSLKNAGKDIEKGISLIKSQMEDVLNKFGLEKIKTSPGDKFDPSLQEAVDLVKNDEYESGSVLEEIESGYKFNGKVIRPSRVRVVE